MLLHHFGTHSIYATELLPSLQAAYKQERQQQLPVVDDPSNTPRGSLHLSVAFILFLQFFDVVFEKNDLRIPKSFQFYK